MTKTFAVAHIDADHHARFKQACAARKETIASMLSILIRRAYRHKLTGWPTCVPRARKPRASEREMMARRAQLEAGLAATKRVGRPPEVRSQSETTAEPYRWNVVLDDATALALDDLARRSRLSKCVVLSILIRAFFDFKLRDPS